MYDGMKQALGPIHKKSVPLKAARSRTEHSRSVLLIQWKNGGREGKEVIMNKQGGGTPTLPHL